MLGLWYVAVVCGGEGEGVVAVSSAGDDRRDTSTRDHTLERHRGTRRGTGAGRAGCAARARGKEGAGPGTPRSGECVSG